MVTIGIGIGLGMQYASGSSFSGGKGVGIRSYSGGRAGSLAGTAPSGQPAGKQPAWMQSSINKLLKGKPLSKGDLKRIEQHIYR